jgi:hypothetical protein
MTAAIQATVEAFVTAKQSLLGNLWARWQDEKEYEDINEYGMRIAKDFPEGWKLIKSSKRPFGVVVQIEAEHWQISVTGRSISYKRVK